MVLSEMAGAGHERSGDEGEAAIGFFAHLGGRH